MAEPDLPAGRSPRRWGLLLALGLLALGAACNRGAGHPEAGRVTAVQGVVELTRDGTTDPVAPDEVLFREDLLSVRGGGTVDFVLGGPAGYRLVGGGARIEAPGGLRLEEGTLVAEGEEPFRLDLGSAELALERGTVRVELGSGGRIGAYEAEDLVVTAGGREVPVPRLWQISVTADGQLEQARPIQFSRDDPVDAFHLAPALEVDAVLANLLRGLDVQLAATGDTALAGHLESAGIGPETVEPFASAGPSDRLMGLAFARVWKAGAPEELVRGFEQVMTLRVLGATWGLVAQIFGLEAPVLLEQLEAESAAVLIAGPSDKSPQQLVPPPAPAPAPPPTAPGAPAPAPVSPPPAPAPTPTPTSGGGLLEPVVDPLRPLLPAELEAIVDEIYGLIQGLLPVL